MRGPESMDFSSVREQKNIPHVDRDVVLAAISKLKKENENVDLTDIHNPAVKEVYDLFVQWTKEMSAVEDAEEKLTLYLQEHMLMYDAGLVNGAEALQQLDSDLADQLEQVKDDNFLELEKKIQDYREEIAQKLKRVR